MTFDPEQVERDYLAALESFDRVALDRRCDAVRERIEARSEPLYARLRDLRYRSQLPPPGPRLNPSIGASDHAPQDPQADRLHHEPASLSPSVATWRVRVVGSLAKADHASPDASPSPDHGRPEGPLHGWPEVRMTPDPTPDLLADHVLGSYHGLDPFERADELAQSATILPQPVGGGVTVIVVTENDSSGIVR